MKGYVLLFTMSAALFAGDKFTANEIITPDMWSEGFSADVKFTTNFPGIKGEAYKIYCDDEGNVRTESGSGIVLFIYENDEEKIYIYDNLTKTGMATTPDAASAPEKPFRPAEDETLELVGSGNFAGVQCDKYQTDTRGTEVKGQLFYYVDPSEKILMGYENISADQFKRAEYTRTEFESDKEMFKPLEGYNIK
jgi:hypothetical protein